MSLMWTRAVEASSISTKMPKSAMFAPGLDRVPGG